MPIPPFLKSKDAAAIALLIMVGLVYYGQTYDYGFNTGDEGSLMLLTMRILEGERPYLDLQLGYGLLWYYPLVVLFKVTGVSFIVARIYLLSLAVLGSLLAYLTIRGRTGIVALAVNVGLLYLALPGDLQNIYIPLVVLANMLAMSSIDLDQQVLDARRVLFAGIVIGISAFVRAELAVGAALILLVTLIAHTLFNQPRGRRPRRLARLCALAGGGVTLPALPLILYAYSQGFGKQLLVHMTWPIRILSNLHLLTRKTNAPIGRVGAENDLGGVGPDVSTEVGATLARVPLAAIWEDSPARILGILTYLPLITMALITVIACWRMLLRWRQSRSPVANDTLGLLVLVGLTLSSFPQFIFFRPDAAHLSFFMPGYFVLAAVYLGREVFNRSASGAGLMRLARLAFGVLLVAHIGIYFWYGLKTATTGSMIAHAHGRTERFVGKNGVEVAVTPIERYLFDKVTRTVEAHSTKDEPLLCFPFGPGWNVLTDRRTFAQALYADDSLAASPWQQKMLESIGRERPPVIIVDNWPINGTEVSRFKNWATQIMSHIASEYVLLDSIGSLEIYGRKETVR